MPLSTSVANSILALILNATAWTSIADNAASSPATNFYISGHTADPGAAGNQTTNELSYTGYARQALARSTSGFTAPSSGSSSNAAQVSLGACTAGSGTMTYFGIGLASSGSGTLLGRGALTSSLAISAGITPIAAIGAITFAIS